MEIKDLYLREFSYFDGECDMTVSILTKETPTSKGGVEEMRFNIPKGCTLFKRKSDGRWVARMMTDGEQKFIACHKSKKETYDKLMKA